MRKFIPAILFILATTFGQTAAAEQPCVGSSSTCTWTCNQDGDGNIESYNVSCHYGDYCVDAATNDWIIGTCDELLSSDEGPDPFEQIEALEIHLEKVGPVCPPKK